VAGLATTFGSGAMTNSISDIKDAGCILAIGSNTTATHPVIGMDVRQAIMNGTKLIVVNPREINLCKYADIWLQIKPGSDVALLMGMAKIILDEGLQDDKFIQDRTENFETLKNSLKDFPLDKVSEITGVPAEKIREAARLYASSKTSAILYAMGITQHSHGTDNVFAVSNLAMLTGNIGKPGSGVNPLRGQNNVQGGCDMGGLPGVFTGYQNVDNPDIRRKFEVAWGTSLNPVPGLTLMEIMEAAHHKKIRGMLMLGENSILSEPDIKHTLASLTNLEFFVVQDIFLSETAQLADVVLPSASFAEKEGTFTNTERRVQRVRQAIPPIGQSRADWEIICSLAHKMGKNGFEFTNPAQIMLEIASLTPSYAGIVYERLENGGLQWPCPTTEHPGTAILHTLTFNRGKGKFMPLTYRPSMEVADAQYPLLLTTERSLFHYHTGTMTRKVKGLNKYRGEELVEINPSDASRLGIVEGDVVTVSSRRGEVSAKAKLTTASPVGLVMMSFHFAESPTNAVTSTFLDPIAKIPELKVCAVKVEKKKA
jgi:formate dehydrogenase alpha subunit